MPDELSTNLALLCSYYPSIAEVCRKLGFNRQQFNKYLGGQSRPSRNSMRRICDFFGVTESELLSDPSQFENLITVRQRRAPPEALSKPLIHVERLYQRSQNLDKYIGFYFRYFYSFGNRGRIIRSIASIRKEDGRYYWKNLEILRGPDDVPMWGLNKYEGVIFYLADRIYIVEYETLERNSITQVALYPSHQHRLNMLVGIQTGGPTRRGRRPGASRLALEYLGKDIDARAALRLLGLFDPESGDISPAILKLIDNSMAPDAFVLDVEEP